MAKVIKFYLPDSLTKKANYTARNERGKLIEFSRARGNGPNSDSAQRRDMGRVYIAPLAVDFSSDGGRDTA